MPHKILPHHENGRFYNNAHEKKAFSIIPTLIMFVDSYWKKITGQVTHTLDWYAPQQPVLSSKEPVLTWIGHSTFLMQIGSINIITDPIFGNLPPLFKRMMPPGLTLNQLPFIDYVIISHNHLDHMDEQALQYLKQNPLTHFLVPKGNKQWFEKRKFALVSEYTWWDQETFNRNGTSISFTFLPAHHWSQRAVFDFNKTLWGSWMISVHGQHYYFAGDTAYAKHFSSIAQEFSSISYALMPIGPCEPRKWMSNTHISAEEAGKAFLDLGAQTLVPMHWGTFAFGLDTQHGPYERLQAWWQQNNAEYQSINLFPFKVGERKALEITPFSIPAISQPTQQIESEDSITL